MMLSKSSCSLFLLVLAVVTLSSVNADCVCECGTVAEKVCYQDACEFICAAGGDYGGDCGKATLVNCEDPECIGAESRLFSCTRQEYVAASQVVMGEELQTVDPSDGSKICSKVFYTLQHELDEFQDQAMMEIRAQNENKDDSVIIVSKNHLLYVAQEKTTTIRSGSYTPVVAKDIQEGDMLLTSDGQFQKVSLVKETTAAATKQGLVNILTQHGTLELENGVVMSAYAFHETLYAAVFYPVRMIYWLGGEAAVESVRPALLSVEWAFKPAFAKLATFLSS